MENQLQEALLQSPRVFCGACEPCPISQWSGHCLAQILRPMSASGHGGPPAAPALEDWLRVSRASYLVCYVVSSGSEPTSLSKKSDWRPPLSSPSGLHICTHANMHSSHTLRRQDCLHICQTWSQASMFVCPHAKQDLRPPCPYKHMPTCTAHTHWEGGKSKIQIFFLQ